MGESPRRPKVHIAALDGVRGLAILMVMCFHIGIHLHPTAAIDSIVRRVLDLGVHGVDLFFVLSGFLITGILVDARGSRAYFRNFYIRRSLRIFPLYYFILVILFVVIPFVFHPTGDSYRRLEANQAWYWTYLVNILVAIRGFDAAPVNTAHFWSLAVEEQFYIIWPFLVAALSTRHLKPACIALVGISLALRVALVMGDLPFKLEIIRHVTPARMDGLALGALLAIVCRQDGGFERLKQFAAPVLGGSLAAFAAVLLLDQVFFPVTNILNLTIGFTIKAAIFTGLIMLALSARASSLVRMFFESEIMRVLGKYSYGLYVYHYLLILVLASFVFPRALPVIAGSALPSIAVFGIATFALSGLVSWLSFTLLEQPMLRLKHRFATPTG